MTKKHPHPQVVKLNNQPYSNIFLFLFLFFLPTQFGKHFFFPFSYLFGVRVDYLAPTIYVVDLLLLPLFVIYRKKIAELFQNRMFFILLLLLIINIFFSAIPYISLFRFLKVIELLMVFAVFYKGYIQKRLLTWAFFAGSVFQTFLVTLQFITKQSLQGIFYFFGERILNLSQPGIAKAAIGGIEILRPYGTFSHPNSLGGFYLLVYTFFLFSKIADHNKLIKSLLLFFCSLLILFSFSKTAIVTFVFMNLLFVFLKRKGMNCDICIIARLFGLGILALIFLNVTSDPASLSKRIELTSHALTLVQTHPLFGVGLGAFVAASSVFSSKFPYTSPQPVHNIFLLILTELGIVISALIGIFFARFVWEKRKNGVFMACLLVVILTGFIDHYWLTLSQNWLLLGVVFGMSLNEG